MTPEEIRLVEQEALAPIIHQYRMGIETLLLAWMAETGHGLKDVEIKDKVVHTQKGDVFSTWLEPKVRI